MLQSLGQPSTGWERVNVKVDTFLSEWLGVPVGQNIALAKAAELAVDRGLEDVYKTGAINSTQMKQIKQYALRNFVDTETSLKTIEQVQERLKDRLAMYLDRNKVNRADVTKEVPQAIQSLQQQQQQSNVGGTQTFRLTEETAAPYLKKVGIDPKRWQEPDIQDIVIMMMQKGTTPAPSPSIRPGSSGLKSNPKKAQ